MKSQQCLQTAWAIERRAAGVAQRRGDLPGAWSRLERAHTLSQPMAWAHVRTHLSMLSVALRRRDGHEISGQLLRLSMAAFGSWTGRYSVGNTGGADVGAFRAMPIPDDLQAVLGDASNQKEHQ